AFGSVFASPTKPGTVHAPLALFAEARRAVGLPLVAIGGITPANAQLVIAAGADALAVISAVFDTPDVTARASELQRLFERPSP
ncbi:MAG: thiamine phosphate synthase, partial [Burkholderiales bacterium]